MKKEPARDFLKLLGAKVPSAQNRAGWVVSNCPLGPWRHDNGQSGPEVFGVKIEGGDSRCHCFSCGFSGTQSDLILEMQYLNRVNPKGTYQFKAARELVMKAEEDIDLDALDSPDIEEMLFGDGADKEHYFPDWWLDTFLPWDQVKFARDYLEERGIHPMVATHLGIRADTNEDRVCFPVRDFSGKLRGLHGRVVHKGIEPRYRMYLYAKRNNPHIWLGEHWVDLDKPVVIVEGPMDLAKVYQVYRNVVSPLFANPSFEKIFRMSDAMEVVTLLDRGTGGDKGRERFSAAMKHSVVTHLMPPSEYKDPGEMPPMEIAELLSEHVPLKKDDFLI